MSNIPSLVDHLVRHESGKLVSMLTRTFGTENLDLAEDAVQDALVEALREWSFNGAPDNPTGWLYRVAKNKALNILTREKHKRKYEEEIRSFLGSAPTTDIDHGLSFSDQEISDDQLRMIFTCCHPSVSEDAQVALTLKTLCGFSVQEIAKAFLTNEETIHKRLVRARQKLREEEIKFEVPEGEAIAKRTDIVLRTIYLLFNEGYSASSGNDIIRQDLCEEAIRLALMIVAHDAIKDKAGAHALVALMYQNMARFPARMDESGRLLTLEEQDRSLWDPYLMERGMEHINKGTGAGKPLTPYHFLAIISATHNVARDFASTDWQGVLELYDDFIRISPSPVAILNRAIASAFVNGPEQALQEMEAIENDPAMKSYVPFYATLAYLCSENESLADAVKYYDKAIELSAVPAERSYLQEQRDECIGKIISS